MSQPSPRKQKGYHNSFFHRIHQRHDERHHPGENRHPEHRPLLQDDHPDSASEVETTIPEITTTSPPQNRPEVVLTKLKNLVSNTVVQSADLVAQTFNAGVSQARQSSSKAFEASKTAALSARSALGCNPMRVLAVACGLFVLIAVAEAIVLYRQPHSPHNVQVCTTASCVDSAHEILNSLHPSHRQMDPCDDFASYVCGGFDQRYELSENQSQISTQTLTFDNIRHLLLPFLSETATKQEKGAEQEILNKARKAYKACITQEKLSEHGLKPLKNLTDELKMIFSRGQTAIRKADNFQSILKGDGERGNQLTQAYLYMLKLGVEPFLSFKIKPDVRSPKQQAVYVEPAQPIGHGFSEENAFNKHSLMHEYERIVEDVLKNFLGVRTNTSFTLNPSSNRILSTRELAQSVVRMETRMNSILPDASDLLNMTKSYNIKTYEEFNNTMPFFSAAHIVHELAPTDYDGTTIILASPVHLQELSETLAATQVEVLQAFCIWKVVQTFSDRIEHESLQKWKEFSERFGSKYLSRSGHRQYDCIDRVDEDLGWVLLRILSENGVSLKLKQRGLEAIQSIKAVVHSDWSTKEWIDENDQRGLEDLIDDLEFQVGFPTYDPDIMDISSLVDYYRNVIISNDTFLDNKIASERNKLYRQWSQLGLPTERESWSMPATLTEVYHDISRNTVTVPAAMMYASFLSSTLPTYLFYSTFGVSAGHEIALLTTTDVVYGNLNGSSWSEQTQNTLKEKEACFVKQYGRFRVDGPDGKVYVDGKNSLLKAIADAGAARAAYNTWAKSEAKQASPTLPGFPDFSPNQLFWLAYGTHQCSVMTPEESQKQAMTGENLPSSVRIKGTVANLREFKEAFNCPTKKPVCELW